jgi:hypothetical protein
MESVAQEMIEATQAQQGECAMSRVFSGLIVAALLGSVPLIAANDVTVIDQKVVMAAGGFPFKITSSGSYKLTSNLVVPADTNGIEFLASSVTLDLNGFTILGPIVCQGGTGPCAPTPTRDTAGINALALSVTIRNGHVQGFSRGVKIFGGLVEGMHASGNVIDGIEANDSVITGNNASQNHGVGIQAFNSVVTSNVATLNGSSGFVMGGGGVFGSNTLKSSLGTQISLTQLVVSQMNSSCDGSVC